MSLVSILIRLQFHKLKWKKIKYLPDWYEVFNKKISIADVFKGKSGYWFVIFPYTVIRSKNLYVIEVITLAKTFYKRN